MWAQGVTKGARALKPNRLAFNSQLSHLLDAWCWANHLAVSSTSFPHLNYGHKTTYHNGIPIILSNHFLLLTGWWMVVIHPSRLSSVASSGKCLRALLAHSKHLWLLYSSLSTRQAWPGSSLLCTLRAQHRASILPSHLGKQKPPAYNSHSAYMGGESLIKKQKAWKFTYSSP